MRGIAYKLDMEALMNAWYMDVQQAYDAVSAAMRAVGCRSARPGVVTFDGGMLDVLRACDALKRLPWFGSVVREVQVFEVSDVSDITRFFDEAD